MKLIKYALDCAPVFRFRQLQKGLAHYIHKNLFEYLDLQDIVYD